MYKLFKKDIELGDGRVITIETGKLAKQAHGSVVVTMGKTMLLATVVSAKESKDDVDFMPLSVEYKENFSAIGRFPGGFLRREGRPGDNQILVARLVDRALRPLFPKDFHCETFVTVNLISADKDIMPDALAGLAASAALTISDVPFDGPISEVRVSRVDGKLIINPTVEQNEKADIEIVVGATKEDIMMVEGEMSEVSETEMLEAIRFAHEAIKKQCQAQIELAKEIGKAKRDYNKREFNEELFNRMNQFAYQRIYDIAKSGLPKQERSDAFEAIKEEFILTIPEEERELLSFDIYQYYHDIEKQAVRNLLLDEKLRVDGRKPNEIRPIWSEVDYLPATHGSSIFTRGETQSLTTVTLGTKLDEKIIDEVMEQGRNRFLLHYNFPPFSTGDARAERGISRREIGHGNLAHRAIKRMLPSEEDNSYTIRVVSTILESNGSSSMATVCAGTLALMDAGVQLKRPVSGIAMGLIMDNQDRYEVLSDILGDEDHLGDMDFKVTGTEKGITACQMDIKVNGMSYEVLEKALNQANEGRAHILSKMLETISEPRPDYKPHVPRIEKIFVPKDMIGAIIGPGGKIIQEIQSTTGTVIVIEEKDEQGIVLISAENKENIEAAKSKIRGIVEVPEIGNIYTGKVKSIVAFGAFVEILPGKDGLLHISEIEWKRLNTVEEVLKEGQMVEVKLIEIDKKSGKLKLSRKALLPKPEGK
jgi:polyribonucleotide nucleotidyltransferase